MANYLGADLSNLNNLITYFFSILGTKIHIILDPAHMIKLIRNQFAKGQILYEENNEKIEWHYVAKLNRIQVAEGLRLDNKR